VDHWADKSRRKHCGTQGRIAGHRVKKPLPPPDQPFLDKFFLFLATDAARWKPDTGKMNLEAL